MLLGPSDKIKPQTDNSSEATRPAKPKRPDYLPVALPNLDNIPAALKAHRRWLLWSHEWSNKPDDYAKVPYTLEQVRRPQVRAVRHKANRPDSAVSYTVAIEAMHAFRLVSGAKGRPEHWGVGYVVTEQDGIVGLDWDDCRDPETGVIDPAVLEIVRRLDSYTEISPSGRGLRMFLLGVKPGRSCKKGKSEMYANGRYLTVTGHHLEGTPADVMPRQEQLEAYYRELFPDEPARSDRSAREYIDPELAALGITPDNDVFPEYRPKLIPPMKLSDQEILTRAFAARNGDKIKRLWDGDISDYNRSDGKPDRSRADAALASMLAFWIGPDPDRLWALMLQSCLRRQKWNRPDYRERTLKLALNGRRDYHRDVQPQYERDAGEFEPEDMSDPDEFDLLGYAHHFFDHGEYNDLPPGDLLFVGPPTPQALKPPSAPQQRMGRGVPSCCKRIWHRHRKSPLVREVCVMCNGWGCPHCAPGLKEEWKASLRDHLGAHQGDLYVLDVPSADWKRVYRQLDRAGPRMGARAKFVKVQTPAGYRITTTVPLAGPQGITQAVPRQQAITQVCADIDVLPLCNGKPISTSREWGLPRNRGSGEWTHLGEVHKSTSEADVDQIMQANRAVLKEEKRPQHGKTAQLRVWSLPKASWATIAWMEHLMFQLKEGIACPYSGTVYDAAGNPIHDDGGGGWLDTREFAGCASADL